MRKDTIERNKMRAKYNNESWLGKKFGTLSIVGFEHKENSWYWLCKCECGSEKLYNPYKVINGTTKSCGCGKITRCREMTQKYRVKHSGRKERLYHIWRGMKDRCHNPQSRDYEHYGAKGVEVCAEWLNDYATFRKWALNNGYENHLTIDRINPYGNYEATNCRWLSLSLQNRNKRKTRKIELNGREIPLVEVCEQYGLKYVTVYARIYRRGIPPEQALFSNIVKT